jgi:hypothetical protein
VTAEQLDARDGSAGVTTRQEERRVPRSLTPVVALVALLIAAGELVYLRRRGDI